jgi:hypothetical protein
MELSEAIRSIGAPMDSQLPWPQTVRDFEALVDAYQHELVRYAFSRVGNLQDAEDAVQEVLVRAYRDREKRTRVYRFDALTSRLQGLQVFVHANAQDVLVFEVTEVRYNEPIDPALFALELPVDVVRSVSPEEMPAPAGAVPTNAKEAATLFFESLSREDYSQLLTVYPVSTVDPKIKTIFGGLKVNSIGEPFQSGLYHGWFVPYEIQLKNGEVKKHNLAIRNDSRQKRFQVDGGF